MGFLSAIRDNLFYDATPQETVKPTLIGIPDGDLFCNSINNIWQYDYALAVVTRLLSSYLVNCEWNTYKEGKRLKGEVNYILNYAPNRKESSAEFFGALAYQLVTQRQALIIQTSDEQLYVANSYEFLNNEEQFIKPNVFTNVQVGNATLNRRFKENRDCIFIKLPYNAGVEAIFNSMQQEYAEVKRLVADGAKRAMGMKLNLKLSATAKNKYDEKYLNEMNIAYKRLMTQDNALFISYNGEELLDLTEKQRGSEVQQILELANNNIAVNNEVLKNVARAYGITVDIAMGTISTENTDNFIMTMTTFVKPIIKLLSEKFSLFLLEKESILKGSRIVGNLDTVKYVDVLKQASSIDKLIGSGMFSINELREKTDDNAVENGDTRFITKNYAKLDDYVVEEGG